MSADLLAAMAKEVEALRAELAEDPRYLKLRHLEALTSLYRGDPDQPVFAHTSSAQPQFKPSTRKTNPERARAIEAATLLVRNRIGPVSTIDVLDHLSSMGISIGGVEPRNNLSAMLSNSGLFTSNGRKGWTIRKEGDPAEKDDPAESDDDDHPFDGLPPKAESHEAPSGQTVSPLEAAVE